MPTRRTLTRLLLSAFALLFAAPSLALSVPESARAKDAFDDGVHRVENLLLLDHETVAPGTLLKAGVHFEMSPGWHVYWRNAGEGGMSTDVVFDAGDPLPGPVQWPAPSVYSEGGGQIITFGYGETVLLLSEIPVPEDAEGELEIQAAVDYLVCEVECIPGQAQLSRTVRIAPEAKRADPEVLAIFEANEARLPRTAAERGFDVAVRYSHTPIAAPDRFQVQVDVDPCPGGAEGADCTRLAKPTDLAVAALVFDEVPHIDLRVEESKGDASGWRVSLRGRASPDAPSEDARLSGVVLLHDADGAFLPTAFEVPLPRFEKAPSLELASAAGTAPASGTPGGPALPVFQVLLLAFAGGMLLNLMPCVFPVLAIKAFAFVNVVHEERQSIYLHSVAYTGGIVASLLLLALVVAGLQSAGTHVGWGFQFQEPRFIAVVSAVLVLFAANLFGVFEVGMPGGRMASVTEARPGARRSFGEGILAVVLATPCSAPFLGTAVGFAFASHPAMIFAVFATLGLGLAAPFVALTLVPGLTRLLPKPGGWMLVFKQLLGFALLGTTVWLLWLIGQMTGTDGMIRLIAFLLVVALGAWAYGAAQPKGGRLKWSVGAVAAAGIVLGGFTLLDLSPAERGQASTGSDGPIAWIAYEESAVGEALRAGRPVFVDFTADWCITCQVNKARVLETAEVASVVDELDVAMMIADWTHRDDGIRAKLAEFGKAGVPMYLVYSPHAPGTPKLLPELLTRNLVIDALRQASTDG
jgi:thiol:disulfide interchange protein/DsbC/DsbD-like thiol-disulfide interchange protein